MQGNSSDNIRGRTFPFIAPKKPVYWIPWVVKDVKSSEGEDQLRGGVGEVEVGSRGREELLDLWKIRGVDGV